MKRIILIIIIFYLGNGLIAQEQIKKYYNNGSLKVIGQNNQEGEEMGIWKYYYKNGQLGEIGEYKNGIEIGIWKSYYENGQLEEIGKYENGEQTGVWKSYYKNGNLKKSQEYKNGDMTGEFKLYFENGQLKIAGSYSAESELKAGEWKYYYENGQLKEVGNYTGDITSYDVDNNKTGEWKSYYENGNLREITLYDEGHKIGETKKFNDNGKFLDPRKTISGTTRNQYGPLANVKVDNRSAKTTTKSDSHGKYTIKGKVGDYLMFSYPEMENKYYEVTEGTSTFNVTLVIKEKSPEIINSIFSLLFIEKGLDLSGIIQSMKKLSSNHSFKQRDASTLINKTESYIKMINRVEKLTYNLIKESEKEGHEDRKKSGETLKKQLHNLYLKMVYIKHYANKIHDHSGNNVTNYNTIVDTYNSAIKQKKKIVELVEKINLEKDREAFNGSN